MASWPSPPPVVYDNGKKIFIPLENHPSALTRLSSLLGVHGLSYHDVVSLADLDVVPVPRPVVALIFIAHKPVYEEVRASEPHRFGPQSASPATFALTDRDAPVTWFPQTIGHACGLMALLHVLLNLPSAATSPSPSSLLSRHVPSSSPLHDLLTDFPNLSPTERAQRVYDSAFLEHAHMTAAAVGDTAPPSPADENNMHFLAFVKGRDGRFWELDGGWSGPIELGTLGDEKEGRQGEDCLSERALNWGPRRFAQVAERLGDWGCSCVAVVDDETR